MDPTVERFCFHPKKTPLLEYDSIRGQLSHIESELTTTANALELTISDCVMGDGWREVYVSFDKYETHDPTFDINMTISTCDIPLIFSFQAYRFVVCTTSISKEWGCQKFGHLQTRTAASLFRSVLLFLGKNKAVYNRKEFQALYEMNLLTNPNG